MNTVYSTFLNGYHYAEKTLSESVNLLWEGRKIFLLCQGESLDYVFEEYCTTPQKEATQITQSPPLPSTPATPAEEKVVKLDPKFICDDDTLRMVMPDIQECLILSSLFDARTFLIGAKNGNTILTNTNTGVLNVFSQKISTLAENLANEKSISLVDAYKLIIGVLDKIDATKTGGTGARGENTFPLRSAVLNACQKHGIELSSWMVYTRGGKPVDAEKWPFLDSWKNWVPETQAAMLKFSEATKIKAKRLADNNLENQVVLLKGGYGAGKTRLANELYGDESEGVIAPDLGKRVVRRAMENVSHSTAHIQGSQIAYKLFDDLLRSPGTAVYDSSLSRPKDVQDYLEKCKGAKKKMIIHDTARLDVARILSVLKRDVGGDDPRIGPGFIIESAVLDKMNRVKCMEVILQANANDGNTAPEYHFRSGDSQGWNSESVMILKPNNISILNPEGTSAKERLALEGIEFIAGSNTLKLTITEDDLRAKYNTMFEKRVDQLMLELSVDERAALDAVFSSRKVALDPGVEVVDISSLYKAMPASFKKALPESSFQEALKALKPETLQTFLEEVTAKQTISYLDLPLRAALIINQNLQESPWN